MDPFADQLRAQIQAAAARSAGSAGTNSPTPGATRTAAEAIEADQQRRAAQLQARSTAQSVFFFGGAGAASAALRSQAPRTAGALLTFTTGFEFVEAAAAARAAGASASRAVRPTAFAALLAGPQPVGVVPPEVYGLRPDYLDVRLIPEALQFETLNTKADVDRLAAFLASNARAAFESELVALGKLPLPALRQQIQAIEALPAEARIIGAPLQAYYATAVETLRRRESLANTFGSSTEQTAINPALFISNAQAAQINAGNLLAVPVAPLTRPQVPGAPPVALQRADALPSIDVPATGAPSVLDLFPGDELQLLPALFPSLMKPTTSGNKAREPDIPEGQREHFTERVDP